MLQNSRQLRGHGAEAIDWNAEFAVIQSSGPRGGTRHIKESLFRVEGYQNVVVRRRTQITNQIVIVGFERSQDLPAEYFRCLLALVVQDEMAAFALDKISLDVLLALGFCQILLHGCIRTQIKRMLP